MALALERHVLQSIPMMEGGLQRPQSALARGVQITELSDGLTNPDPIILQEPDIVMGQYLSPTKLQLLTGCERLEGVSSLELKVDTSQTTLNNFGLLLPNLTVLKLSGSLIPKVRDLGSSLNNLGVLWMARCGVQELDGISAMGALREVYLSYNEIDDLSPLSLLEELEVLDLEGNNIEDIGQVDYLALCPRLQHLTVEGNPICVTPTADSVQTNYDYRQAVARMLVNLLTLDDKSLTNSKSESPQNVFQDDWAFLEELQNDAVVMESLENEKETVSSAGRPTTAALKPAADFRPGSTLKPSSGFRPVTGTRPASISGGRPSSAWTDNSKPRPASSDQVQEGMESASDLTCGLVVCGNPSKALRARSKNTKNAKHSKQEEHAPDALSSLQLSGTTAVDHRGVAKATEEDEEEEGDEKGPIEDKDLSQLMQELLSWKTQHEQRLEKIRESKAPQVFTVEHTADDNPPDAHSDISDGEDLDLRPDSVMELYHAQQTEREHLHSGDAVAATDGHGVGGGAQEAVNKEKRKENRSHGAPQLDREVTHSHRRFRDIRALRDVEGLSRGLGYGEQLTREGPPDDDLHTRVEVRDGEQRAREDSRGYDQLTKEHLRRERFIREGSRDSDRLTSERDGERITKGSLRDVEPATRELGGLRVGGGGLPRPASPRRLSLPVPPPPSSPWSRAEPVVSSGSLSPRKERPRKLRIGPTGLPGSSHSQQPQIREVLSPPGKPGVGVGVGMLVSPPPTSSAPSSGGGQSRIRRSLPEVPPLPSRLMPLPKS